MTITVLRRTCLLGMLTAFAALSTPAGATYPGLNGRITFGASTNGSYQLYTVQPNGTGLRQITDVAGDAVQPDWSPDGRLIVFEIDHPENYCSIALMSASGGPITDLTGGPINGCEAQPSFTPDGQRIVFEWYNADANTDAVWSMDLTGGDRHEITPGTAGVTDPNVSPDGQTVSFIDYNGQDLGQALATTGIDGSNLTDLVPFTSDVAIKQDWAPDGSRLVFTDNADNLARPANVATVRPDGTGLRYLTDLRSTETRAYTGGYSPDGQWIVFRLEDHGAYSLVRMRPTGGAWHTILGPSTTFKPRFIDWGTR